ncbi:MAG: hypothetical protein RIS36_1359 [Pseudomonadota bacterium]|jgi:MFS family permease
MGTLTTIRTVVDSVEVDRINYLNILLMVASIIVASYVPFETFVVAYAVMGPLHYLTEISWLHDRAYFTSGRKDWYLLLGAAVVAAIGAIAPGPITLGISSFAVGSLFVIAAAMVFCRSGPRKTAIFVLGIAVGALTMIWNPLFILLTAFLPTLIHVYLFTGLFILYGAVKGRSFSGILSLLVFLAAPLICMFIVATPAEYAPSAYSIDAASPFDSLGAYTLKILGLPITKDTWLGFMRVMGFAYSYHYLNWFSKTRIISWHSVPRPRLYLIGVVYLSALTLYAYDYRLGFMALMTLSFAHVMLELPLNYRTIAGLIAAVPCFGRRRGKQGY